MTNERTIRETAIRLGAKPSTVAKWRQRGVPAAWVLKLMDAGMTRQQINAVKSDAPAAAHDAAAGSPPSLGDGPPP
jgi:hypothetical protein